jgi:hypothetical protein
MILGRFLMRLLLVPLGGCIAIVVAMMFVMVAQWNRVSAMGHDDISGLTTFFVVMPMLAASSGIMLLPGIVTALIAEAFAIRSWMYHAACGGLAALIGLMTFGPLDADYDFSNVPLIVVGAGIAAGFAYWLIAGWSAGFWKPVFAPRQPALPPKEIAGP